MRNSVAKWAAIFLWLGVCSAYADNENAGTPLSSLIQPGFYGRVAIGEGLPPPVVYTYPILINAPTHPAHRAPL